MRSAFGRFAQELRLKRGLSQKDFAELAGYSMAHVSNLEHHRMNVNDKVVGVYIDVLNCTGEEACELRKLANFGNGLRKTTDPTSPNTPIQVMLEAFGDRISPRARAKIQEIIERETGEQLDALTFASNQRTPSKPSVKKRTKRPELSPQRLVEISLIAEKVRLRVCGETRKIDIGAALEKLSFTENNLDYDVLETLPSELDGAFAAIVGHDNGHTIILEEKRFLGAINGVFFSRHVVAHELGHHFLHSRLLESKNGLYLPPQELAKNTPSMFTSERRIEQVVDTLEEVEAECFATLFLVPWTAFLKGTEVRYLAEDYGEQLDEVKRYSRLFVLDNVKDAFRWALWHKGIRQHPIFD